MQPAWSYQYCMYIQCSYLLCFVIKSCVVNCYLLFGSKLGFSQILDSLYGTFWHAFGYNSAENEQIWVKSGALLITLLEDEAGRF